MAQENNEERALRARQRQIQMQMQMGQQREIGDTDVPSSFLADEATLQNRMDLTTDPLLQEPGGTPFMIGVGKFFSDAKIGLTQRGHLVAAHFSDDPESEKEHMDEFFRLSQESADNQRLFNILKDRTGGAGLGEIFAAAGSLLVIPGAKEKGAANLLTAPRRFTMGTEAAAGLTAASVQPLQDPDDVLMHTLAGTALGPAVLGIMRGVSNVGRVFIGGKPANIQTAREYLEAEKALKVTGLLSTGEFGNHRIMQMIEGVMDNIPVPLIGFSGVRDRQRGLYDNAMRQIRAAFPDITEDHALRLLNRQLSKNDDLVEQAFRKVTDLVPDGAPNVQMTHYVRKADEMLAKEMAKGASANQKVISELEALIKQGPVDFNTARAISGDIATKIRKADRAGMDPAASALDAGRQKQLAMSLYRDLETWVRQFPEGGAARTQWETAKTMYKELVLPFNKRPLAPLFDAQGFDSYALGKTILDPAKAGKLAELDERGALSWLFVNNMIEKHTKGGLIDVRAFARDMDRLKNRKAFDALGVSVPKESVEMVRALSKLVEASPRAFRKGTNILQTVSGSAAAIGVVGAGALGSDNPVAGAVAGGLSIGAMRFFLGSPAGRRILNQAAHTPKSAADKLGAIAQRGMQTYIRYVEAAMSDSDTQMQALQIAQEAIPQTIRREPQVQIEEIP